MDNIERFYKLKSISLLVDHLRQKIQSAIESNWATSYGLTSLFLKEEDFIADPKITSIIQKFSCYPRLSIKRTDPFSCYVWHRDANRNASINMLIDGYDSSSLFGKMISFNWFHNLEVLPYEPARYYLMDVTQHHTVINLNNYRYVLTIGFHPPTTYNDVKMFILENDL